MLLLLLLLLLTNSRSQQYLDVVHRFFDAIHLQVESC